MNTKRWMGQNGSGDIFKGMAGGLIGGLAASWVMTQFQNLVPASAFQRLFGENEEASSGLPESEPATVKAAKRISKDLFGHELTEQEKEWAGPAVHYSFGSLNGALYGTLAEIQPLVTTGAGIPFGITLWFFADEAGVPAAGLSAAPWEHPPSVHVYALASHLVYGLTTEVVRRLVRSVI